MLLSEVASYLTCKYEGSDLQVIAMNDLSNATSGQLSFISNKEHLEQLKFSKASAFLVAAEFVQYIPHNTSYIVCDDILVSMARATKLFEPKKIDFFAPEPEIGFRTYIDERANVENGASIGDDCMIMAGAYLGSFTKVGNNTTIYPNVTIYRDTEIGNDCIIHAGSVIGADGFGFSHTPTGEHIKIYQNGNVVIEDDVEIGANCAIDRAMFGTTRIKKGVKLDNFIHIGHNCEIGEYCLFVAQSGVGGSTKLGRNCIVSGQTAFSDHLDIAPFSTFTARSGVTKSIQEPHKVWSGYPLMPHKIWMRLQSKLHKLK